MSRADFEKAGKPFKKAARKWLCVYFALIVAPIVVLSFVTQDLQSGLFQIGVAAAIFGIIGAGVQNRVKAAFGSCFRTEQKMARDSYKWIFRGLSLTNAVFLIVGVLFTTLHHQIIKLF